MALCPLCRNSCEAGEVYGKDGLRDATSYDCPTCGRFIATGRFISTADSIDPSNLHRLSAFTRWRTEKDAPPPELGAANYDDILQTTPEPDLQESAQILLDFMSEEGGRGRGSVPLRIKHDWPLAFVDGPEAFRALLNNLLREGLIEQAVAPGEREARTPNFRLTLAGVRLVPRRHTRATTGWERVDRMLREIRRRVGEAETEEQNQAVGHLCREAILSVAQAVYDRAKHPHPQRTEVSDGDAKGMLACYFAAALKGSSNEQARALAKAAEQFASGVSHDRASTQAEALICVESTVFLATLVGILASEQRAQEGPEDPDRRNRL